MGSGKSCGKAVKVTQIAYRQCFGKSTHLAQRGKYGICDDTGDYLHIIFRWPLQQGTVLL
jgi:hypothetical protein